LVLGILYYSLWALSFDLSKVTEMPQSTIIYDRNGEVIQRVYSENRVLVEAKDIPQNLKDALVATEDQRFYWHYGVDPVAIFRAAMGNFTSSRIRSGASTITQQLARNTAGMFERTFDRKLKEMFLAVRLEFAFTKDEILTQYLNRIFFGRNLYGIGAAAEAYFGKHPRDLTVEESALICGIISSPNAASPWKNPALAKKARQRALTRMAEQGYITEADAAKWIASPLNVRPIEDLPGSYVVSAVRDELPSFLTDEHFFQGGLRIYTTIDIRIQRKAEQELEAGLKEVEKWSGYRHVTRAKYNPPDDDWSRPVPYIQGAFVAVSNEDGGILALVGGRDYEESKFNRAYYAKRQIGSNVKPFVYTHAFNTLNCTAFTLVDKSEFDLTQVKEGVPPGHGDWVTLREALQRSDNYCAMRTGMAAGTDSFAYFMKHLTGQDIPPYPSSFLGAFELTPMEVATAYTLFPNYGVIIKPYLIQKVYTHDGKLVQEHIDERRRVLAPQVAFQITKMMESVVNAGTAASLRSRFGFKEEMGGKTGTTNDYKDTWFSGFTTAMTATVWCGFDEPQTISGAAYASRVAVPIWGKVMQEAVKYYPSGTFYPPPGVTLAHYRGQDVPWGARTSTDNGERRFLFFKLKKKGEAPAAVPLADPEALEHAEFVRDDQLENALARIDSNVQPAGAESMQNANTGSQNWFTRFFSFERHSGPEQHTFVPVESGSTAAVINDNVETVAPKAVPVAEPVN
jgi:penicillin-binding protein 1A